MMLLFFFFSSRRRHTRWPRDWSSDVCSSDLAQMEQALHRRGFDEEVITTVLGEFDDAGLIDDRAFAKAWVSSRHHSRGLSRRALSRELRTRGVEEEFVHEAVEELTDEDEEEARS